MLTCEFVCFDVILGLVGGDLDVLMLVSASVAFCLVAMWTLFT